MALVKLFKESDMDFSSDGDLTLSPNKALVHEVLNGDFYLDLELFHDQVPLLDTFGIVAVNYRGSWQGFRLGYSETLVNVTYFKCWHVSYDMKDYLIQDLDLDNTQYNVALAKMKSATTRPNPFTFTTEITDVVDMDIHNATLHDGVFALVSSVESLIVRDNYNISLVTSTNPTFVGVSTEYYQSVSKDEQIGGIWTPTKPEWMQGEYIWCRTKIVNTDGVEYTEPYCYIPTLPNLITDTSLVTAETLVNENGEHLSGNNGIKLMIGV